MPHHTTSPEETIALGYRLGQSLQAGAIVCFEGDLAAGKTTFIKGLVEGAAGYSPHGVHSPTFVYLNIYAGKKIIYHFDLYRLSGVEAFIEMGFDEQLFGDGICCIEWSERIHSLLSTATRPIIYVRMRHLSEEERLISITPDSVQ